MGAPRDRAADAPFLAATPPAWIARALAALLVALFVGSLVAMMVIRLPDTVASPFVLVPVRGTDPIRASRGGVVTKVGVQDAEPVEVGAKLFRIQSAPLGDRSAELKTLEAELTGRRAKLVNTRREHESRRSADDTELARLRMRAQQLDGIVALKRQQHALTAEMVSRYDLLRAKGFTSRADAVQHELEASRTAVETRTAELDRADTIAAIERLGHEMAMRDTQHEETERRERESAANAEFRAAALRSELGVASEAGLEILAPCSGVVLRARVHAPGAVVADGELLCELACANEQLEAELVVPPSGAGRLASGDVVKLLYDAFPYRRHGVRYGKLRWVSPAATSDSGKPVFRALAVIDDDAIAVNGERRPLLAGMGGSARIVVGRRSLLNYVVAPMQQLRESLAHAPRPPRDRSTER